MSDTGVVVKIIGTDECPLYKLGDEFRLSGKSLVSPYGKAACLILVRDITEVLLKYESMESNSRYVFDCSGCTGLARLEYQKENPDAERPISSTEDIHAIASSLGSYSFFQTFDEDSIKKLLSVMKMNEYGPGDTIIHKGEQGKNLFIVAAGRVEVLAEDGIRIAVLGKGEVFGEMSMIREQPRVATVRSMEKVKVLYLNGEYFRDLLEKSPAVQIYLTRLLARRIANTNLLRFRDFASGISGDLREMPPSELFQTLHMNHKTGVLILKLKKGLAAASFREGELIRAKYGEKEDRDAFFEFLACTEGRFKFNHELPPEETRVQGIGDFMKLLMDGVSEAEKAQK